MTKDLRPYFTLIFIVIFSSLILWLPFLLRTEHWLGLNIPQSDFRYVYGSFDGPLYIIPAKTLYDKNKIDIPGKGLIISLPIRPEYFAAHLPMYPMLIRVFAEIWGYAKSLIFVNVLFSSALAILFYYFLKTFNITKYPLILASVFLFLPRFLVIRSIGAPESIFIFFVLTSLLFFERKNYLLAGIFGGLATVTKMPGILLFIVYTLVFIEQIFRRTSHTKKKVNDAASSKFLMSGNSTWEKLFLLFIPIGLLLVFLLYKVQYNDFFAFFHSGGVVPMPYPFSAFNFQQKWVGSAWLEDIVFYFFMYILTVVTLYKHQNRSLFYFSLVFLMASTFVQHRDIARYTLPLWPMACIAFERFFTSKKFLLAFVVILPAIYLYGWNFLVYNIMPIGDWSPFL